MNFQYQHSVEVLQTGSLELISTQNELQFKAEVQNCKINSQNFMIKKNNAGVLIYEAPTGCTVIIYQNKISQGRAKSFQRGYLFSVTDCEKECPRLSSKFWQVEFDPALKKCD